MPEQPQSSSPAPGWSRSKRIRIGLLLTIGLYAACVALLAILRAVVHWIVSCTTVELLYGPAIVIASTWVLFWAASAALRAKVKDSPELPGKR